MDNYTKKQYMVIATIFFLGSIMLVLFLETMSSNRNNTPESSEMLLATSEKEYASVKDIMEKYTIDIEDINELKETSSKEEQTKTHEILLNMKSSVDEHLLEVKKAKEQKEKEQQEILKGQTAKKTNKTQTQSKKTVNSSSKPRKAKPIKISNYERDLLERLVEAEAGGEPYAGKLAVATVVINRLNSKDFPNTIRGVIYQKNQFTPVANGAINKKASAESKRAVRQVVDEGYRSFGPEVCYFLNPRIATSKWIIRNCTFVVRIGNHDFYK